jgi:hypothetical protein
MRARTAIARARATVLWACAVVLEACAVVLEASRTAAQAAPAVRFGVMHVRPRRPIARNAVFLGVLGPFR